MISYTIAIHNPRNGCESRATAYSLTALSVFIRDLHDKGMRYDVMKITEEPYDVAFMLEGPEL